MSLLPAFLLTAVPGLPILAGLFARTRDAAGAGRLTVGAAGLSLACALAGGALLCLHGPQVVRWAPLGVDAPLALALRLDAVSAVMIVLITFLGTTVLRFSRDYLAGDPKQASFFSWMSCTLGAVLVLVLSGHLLLLLAAWITTSLCLHRLLLHYPERAGAVFSARKKFIVSRAGDVCLLIAALILHAHYATFDLGVLFERIAANGAYGLGLAGVFLAACALLKSAQLPFHSWLPDTMETPTPVSAFMHAGIVNAGGFLVVRFSPVFAEAPAASVLLAVMGALTAAYGALVMLAQPSVKRALAYSTVAQMGFMILQCGLGAYGLALVHICAHSLYKAHAFLTAGSTIGAVPRAALPLRTSALTVGVLAGGLFVALGATVLHVVSPGRELHSGVFAVVLTAATGYVIARAWSAGGGAWVVSQGIAVAAAVLTLGLGLHLAAAVVFAELPAVTPPVGLVLAVGAIFAGLFVAQSLLWRAGRRAWSRRLYVHVLNGFYLGTFFNRVVARLWPRTHSLSHSS
jgi:NAD(P)H-quinone oxidoreductase subunit 5